MPPQPTHFDNLVLCVVVIAALAALVFTVLTPGYTLDIALVYQGF